MSQEGREGGISEVMRGPPHESRESSTTCDTADRFGIFVVPKCSCGLGTSPNGVISLQVGGRRREKVTESFYVPVNDKKIDLLHFHIRIH